MKRGVYCMATLIKLILKLGGEDGLLKVWSRSGMLRSSVTQNNYPIYTAAWSSDSTRILFGQGKHLIIKSLTPNNKTTKVWRWKKTVKKVIGYIILCLWFVPNIHIFLIYINKYKKVLTVNLRHPQKVTYRPVSIILYAWEMD